MRKFSQIAAAAAGIARGTTADRPTNPAVGDQFVNGTLGITEVYTETEGWQPLTSSSTGIPFGGNANRPADGLGQPFFNGDESRLELFTAQSGWQNVVQETPGVVSVVGSYIEGNPSSTLTINGSNFAAGAIASVIGQDGTETQADTTTIVSVAEISATFSGLSATNEPYDVRVLNPSNLFGIAFEILKVDDIPVFITQSGSLGTYVEESPMSVQISVTDEEESPLVFSVSSGSLPAGLSLNTSTGEISGTPINVVPNTTSSFNISATDGENIAVRSFSITITDRGPVWQTSNNLSTFAKDVSYSETLIASDDDGIAGYSIISGSLPQGLTFNSSTGEISGTPSEEPTTIITVRATDLGGNYSDRQFILSNPGPVWQTENSFFVNSIAQNSIQLVAIDNSGIDPSYEIVAGSAPSGISMSSSGLISGISTEEVSSISSFTVRATDNQGIYSDRQFLVQTVSGLYPFGSHTFTTAGVTGRIGPSLAQIQNEYANTSWAAEHISMTVNGVQQWTVPRDSIYRIQAVGARPGVADDNTGAGGKGASMAGDFFLNEGEVLNIVAGQSGAGRSGAGGSFVWKDSDDTLLIAAGGGGGGVDRDDQPFRGRDASISTSGTPGTLSSNSTGGLSGGTGGSGGNGGGSYGGGGGGGWLTPGGGANLSSTSSGSTPGQGGGKVLPNGGIGGWWNSQYTPEPGGGFGGGGGSGFRNAGGGGYSGGGAGGYTTDGNTARAGGGGGSYNSGTNQTNEAGVGQGHGYVVITATG